LPGIEPAQRSRRVRQRARRGKTWRRAGGASLWNPITLSVVQHETALLTELVGRSTAASGSESAPTWAIKVVDMQGNVALALTNAEVDKIVWTLNKPDEFSFIAGKNAYTLANIPVIGTASGAKEVQIFRNGQLVAWGPIIGTSGDGSQGDVKFTGAGVDWYLEHRFLDGTITNLLTNADFESGTSNWTAQGGLSSFTQDSGNFYTGANSAQLVCSGPGDSRIIQYTSAGPNGVGLLITFSAWFYIDSITAANPFWTGLLIEGYDNTGAFQKQNWYPIDTATPQKKWTHASATIWIPPNQQWTLKCSLWAPVGTIHWDDAKCVTMQSIGTTGITGNPATPVDLGNIVAFLVRFLQSPSAGKSELNIGTNSATTGAKMAYDWQYVDHVQWDQALKTFVDRNDGLDYSIDLTTTTRTFHSYARKRGTDRSGSVTLKYVAGATDNNCTSYRDTTDAGKLITRSKVLGSNSGPDREQGESSDATQVGGVIIEDVTQAPQEASVAALQPMSAQKIKLFKYVPHTIEMDLKGDTGLIPTIRPGDLVTVNLQDGYVTYSGVFRIMSMTIDAPNNIAIVALAKDDLT
jgi:hypothetical protein